MSPWWFLLELLSWCLIYKANRCNSFEGRTSVDEIYGCPIFKWVADTLLHDGAPVEFWVTCSSTRTVWFTLTLKINNQATENYAIIILYFRWSNCWVFAAIKIMSNYEWSPSQSCCKQCIILDNAARRAHSHVYIRGQGHHCACRWLGTGNRSSSGTVLTSRLYRSSVKLSMI